MMPRGGGWELRGSLHAAVCTLRSTRADRLWMRWPVRSDGALSATQDDKVWIAARYRQLRRATDREGQSLSGFWPLSSGSSSASRFAASAAKRAASVSSAICASAVLAVPANGRVLPTSPTARAKCEGIAERDPCSRLKKATGVGRWRIPESLDCLMGRAGDLRDGGRYVRHLGSSDAQLNARS
jgi:hypothetical protein